MSYGLKPLKVVDGKECLGHHIGANSEVFNLWDPVAIDTDGFAIVATAGLRVVGVAHTVTLTMAADNETVAQVRVPFGIYSYLSKFEAEMSAAITSTNVGQYADITGTTGAVLIDQASVADATGQVHIVELDPFRVGSTTTVVVSLAEPEQLAYTQN